ncbi:DNA topoisomerase I [Candidatus Woesearchaeota archaeon]|nr:DNA topoisomerase I [Candidatus Woesearchaeota archaeon]
MTELIITEKPSAANKIAFALAEGEVKKESYNKKVPFYQIKHGGKDIIVACAVGHLFTLKEKKKGSTYVYPVYDIEWVPAADVHKSSAFTKQYLNAIKALTKKADKFTVATDYDIEGEVIGWNVIRFICNQKDASRMKYSTLTKPDLIKSYEEKAKTINWGLAKAGETRHILDWLYGINLSRALMGSIKKAGRFQVMSIGRVQGPALKIIVDRELEITNFKPDKYWEIMLDGKVKKSKIVAQHSKGKIFDQKKSTEIYDKVKDEKKGIISDIKKKEMKQLPPIPFDLTTLQTEAFRHLKFSPKVTLQLAQTLYLGGFISYPRTSSQKLPPAIGFKKILADLSKQREYKESATVLLGKKVLKPTEGKKDDPAHPAIYPTGTVPKEIADRETKLYDLIVRRFLAVFGEPAKRLSVEVSVDIKKEIFHAKGITTTFPGWHELYGKYAVFKEEELPSLEKNDVVDVKKIEKLDKETTPPKRFTEASLVRALEKQSLGTKATRSEIVDTLFQRGYVIGKPIEATSLGIKTVQTLNQYSPKILDEEMTRTIEDRMQGIQDGKEKEGEVIEHSKEVLNHILSDFKKNESEIGKELLDAKKNADDEKNTIGPCPNCDGTLMIKRGKFGRFIACNQYPECKTTFNIPNTGTIKSLDRLCEACKVPMISISRGRRPQDVCINPDCPAKKDEPIEEVEKMEKQKCPKCGKGHLILRKSIYGKFMGCSDYPKCKFIQSLNGKDKKDDSKSDSEDKDSKK